MIDIDLSYSFKCKKKPKQTKKKKKTPHILNPEKYVLSHYKNEKYILPRLLERSKKCRCHYFTMTYHATSQWNMRSDAHLSF